MIRLTITAELLSANGESRDRLLGVAHISNVGVDGPGTCSYQYHLSKTLPGRTTESWRGGRAGLVTDVDWLTDALIGEVEAFDSVKRGLWDLLYQVLARAVGGRNGRRG